MSSNIYELLNDVQTDMENYKAEEPDDIERKRWKKKAAKDIIGKGKKKRRWKPVAGVCAAAVILAVGVGSGPLHHVVQAAVKSISYDIASILGIKKDLEPYKTVIGKSVTSNGITITLNEVIVNEDEIIVSSTKEYDEKITDENKRFIGVNVYINGKSVSDSASGGEEQVGDNTIVSVSECDIKDVDLSQTFDFEIQYMDYDNMSATWEFEFSASGEELAQSTNTVQINKTFTLDDGTEVYLDKFTDNPLGQKIYFSTSTGNCDYDLVLRGTDDCGNAVEFTLSRWSNGVGRMNISTIDNGNLSDDATELYLTPYAVKFPEQSGKLSNDFKQAGEAFTIDIRPQQK